MLRQSVTLLIWAGYVALICTIVVGVTIARQRILSGEDVAREQRDWDDWREEVVRQREERAPVSRRVPQSDEPPTRVLLRDHFTTSVVVLVVLSSALYFALAMMIRGVVTGPAFRPDIEDVG